ncbi:helix-turn-helix transcriptional regulator [Novosphingobium guangzhouense]|uniref:LuxR family transcriptional regulator n=1 Tax=Novosphingobium guangzhouense TaxID=1850347 RepID=A0A2K2G2S4_9SPHN|nr:LuxR C-terminal-related transcriptional regulator [Novosphingobium guangzhouense]PNU05339.1 LuxR family transcriptional regulator [Novosphingobium guangzhouense]
MTNSNLPGQGGVRARGKELQHVFLGLTSKQHEVLRFVSENRTSKEIAWELGISESAVNQRIEGVRIRAGSPPRAELARAYRQYLQDQEAACKQVPDKIPQVPEVASDGPVRAQDETAGGLALSDVMTYTVTAPWQREAYDRIVPEVLDGANAGLSRTAAMVAIAGGMMLVAMVGLGVVRALTDLI